MIRSWAGGALVVGAAILPLGLASFVGQGCGDGVVTEDGGVGDDAADASDGSDAGPTVTVLTPDLPPLPGESECKITITTGIPLKQAIHVPLCTDVEYATNPPSGGDHWPMWAAYTTYEVPVPREMYVHNMEHGTVVLLHNCEGDCSDVLSAFAKARDELAGDPKCLQIPDGPKERVVTTPDPDLDVPLAAAAWGSTYKATCIDLPSLRSFVKKAYDKATESTCAQGKLVGAEDGGAPVCVDGGLVDAGNDATGGGGTGGEADAGSSGGADAGSGGAGGASDAG